MFQIDTIVNQKNPSSFVLYVRKLSPHKNITKKKTGLNVEWYLNNI